MGRMTIEELDRELAATSEPYVRHKLATGKYLPYQRRYVEAWLDQREAERAEKRAAEDRAIVQRNVFWSKVAALATLAGSLIAAAALLPKVW
jgi:hypothetical protein